MQVKPQLLDQQIYEVKQTLEQRKASLKKIMIKYSAAGKDKTTSIEAHGISEILHNDEYYENILDHLMYANLRWLSPMSREMNKELEVNYEVELEVNPDGSMNHEHIKFNISTNIFKKTTEKFQIMSTVKTYFSRLIPFRQYIKKVTFKGHNYNLSTITFSMDLDGLKVNSILKNNQAINQQVLAQWLATVDHILDHNKGVYKFIETVSVTNGKMNNALFETAFCFSFKEKGGRK